MYENRRSPPLPRAAYVRRLVRHGSLAAGMVVSSLAAGMVGYRIFENLAWGDAFLHAALLLGGMGLAQVPQTSAGKVFAGLFALYAGVVFIAVTGIVFAPIVHRLLHRFHWDEDQR